MGTAELNGTALEIIVGYVFSVTEMSGECVLGVSGSRHYKAFSA